MALKRLNRELAEIIRNPVSNVCAGPTDNLFRWNATVFGPSGSPYENGVFHLIVEFPEKFVDTFGVMSLQRATH